MRPKSLSMCAAAAAFALCLAPAFVTGARAADGNEGEWYIGANIPVMFIDNTKTGVRGALTLEANQPAIPYTSSSTSYYGLRFRNGVVVGYYVLPNLRIESELFYGFARVKKTVYSGTRSGGTAVPGKYNQRIKGNAKMLGAMANVWYDIETGSAWSPFVGGGIGDFQADFGNLKWDIHGYCRSLLPENLQQTPCGIRPKDKDTVFAYQVGGGVGYRYHF